MERYSLQRIPILSKWWPKETLKKKKEKEGVYFSPYWSLDSIAEEHKYILRGAYLQCEVFH